MVLVLWLLSSFVAHWTFDLLHVVTSVPNPCCIVSWRFYFSNNVIGLEKWRVLISFSLIVFLIVDCYSLSLVEHVPEAALFLLWHCSLWHYIEVCAIFIGKWPGIWLILVCRHWSWILFHSHVRKTVKFIDWPIWFLRLLIMMTFITCRLVKFLSGWGCIDDVGQESHVDFVLIFALRNTIFWLASKVEFWDDVLGCLRIDIDRLIKFHISDLLFVNYAWRCLDAGMYGTISVDSFARGYAQDQLIELFAGTYEVACHPLDLLLHLTNSKFSGTTYTQARRRLAAGRW